MPQQPMEESPFLAPAPEQPSTPVSAAPPIAEPAEPTNGPPASAVAREVPPRPLSKLKRFINRGKLAFILLLVTFCVAVVNAKMFASSDSGDHYAVDLFSPNGSGVTILGEVTRFDWLDTHQLSVTWFVVGVGEYQPQAATESSDWCPPINTAVDVYLDDPSNPAFSYDPTTLPVTMTGERFCPPGLVSFDVDYKILTSSQYNTPLDTYNFTAFAFVVERATNKSIPITMFAVGDSGPADFTTTSVGIQTTSNFTYDTNNGSTTTEVESHMMFATIQHSDRAQALTFFMLGINWILTLCSGAIALIVCTCGKEVKDGVAFLPITVILTIPTIRGLYAGSPPFGIFLDTVGFFPQMSIVLVCSMTVLFFCAGQSIRDKGVTVEKREV